MTQNDTFSFSYYLNSSWKGKLYTKIQGLRIPHIHSNLQYCFLSFLPYFCLTSHHGFEQTAEKCIIFAEEKQHSAIWKQAFIALVCIFFAPSTNESAQGASQEASITTKGGHNRWQAPVIY